MYGNIGGALARSAGSGMWGAVKQNPWTAGAIAGGMGIGALSSDSPVTGGLLGGMAGFAGARYGISPARNVAEAWRAGKSMFGSYGATASAMGGIGRSAGQSVRMFGGGVWGGVKGDLSHCRVQANRAWNALWSR